MVTKVLSIRRCIAILPVGEPRREDADKERECDERQADGDRIVEPAHLDSMTVLMMR